MICHLKKRKRFLISAICCVMLVYGVLQLLHLHDDYSPLQLLSSVENEASRLLKFIGQIQVQCNNSVATNNASTWMLCQDLDFGTGSDDSTSIVYSVGPSPDFNFENFVSRNLSSHLFIFSHQAEKLKFLSKMSPGTVAIFKTTIVPNDPADFARNSFDTQTLNSAFTSLKHNTIDILKLDTLLETVQTYEVLRFLIDDSLLRKVKELHVVLKLDKVEEDYIYSWYRVLYALFHTAEFRLYHTATSDPLCLQDTVMESCKYYLSWIRRPPPQVFVLYPPAIDGSYEYEEERMLTFLEGSSIKNDHLIPVEFRLNPVSWIHSSPSSKKLSLELSQNVVKKITQSCSIIFIFGKDYQQLNDQTSAYNKTAAKGCPQYRFLYSSTLPAFLPSHEFLPLFSNLLNNEARPGELTSSASLQSTLLSYKTNIVYMELDFAWDLIALLSSSELLRHIDQLIIKTSIFPVSGGGGKPQSSLLRRIYSELKRLEEFHFSFVDSDKYTRQDLEYQPSQDIHTLNFVKTVTLNK